MAGSAGYVLFKGTSEAPLSAVFIQIGGFCFQPAPYPRSRLDFQLVKVFLPANYTGRVPVRSATLHNFPRHSPSGYRLDISLETVFCCRTFADDHRPNYFHDRKSDPFHCHGGKREPFNPPFPLAGQATARTRPSRVAASDGSSLFYVFDEIISKEGGRVEERKIEKKERGRERERERERKREVGEWELFHWIPLTRAET